MATPLSLDHSGLGVLSREECLRRIRSARVGRVAFVENGEPVILAFEVDAFDVERLAGWSVVIRGVASVVDDQAEVTRLATFGVMPWADLAERTNWVRIRAYSLTGREVVHPAR